VKPADLAHCISLMSAAAMDAGELIMEVYRENFSVDYKGPDDPVTVADTRANALICERLAKFYPDIPIVAEESDPLTYAGFEEAEHIFFVDPLDGTKEFVKRNDEFAVMIGLVHNDRAIAGVIHAPVNGSLWRGALGIGVQQLDSQGNVSVVRVSDTPKLIASTVVTSRSHRSKKLEEALSYLKVKQVQMLGSAGLKGAAVAIGQSDAWLAPGFAGKRWDACACDALVNAGGGCFTDNYGEPIDYRSADLGNRRGIVAGNHYVHDKIIRRLAAFLEREEARGGESE
jgi:3'(2'), 5'-bisphosphate nucleotidase